MNYYKLKLIGILILPLFHGMAFLGGFQFPVFKYLIPYYGALYPFVLLMATVFFVLGVIYDKKSNKQGWSSDKVITLVGGFFILMNFVVSLIVLVAKT